MTIAEIAREAAATIAPWRVAVLPRELLPALSHSNAHNTHRLAYRVGQREENELSTKSCRESMLRSGHSCSSLVEKGSNRPSKHAPITKLCYHNLASASDQSKSRGKPNAAPRGGGEAKSGSALG